MHTYFLWYGRLSAFVNLFKAIIGFVMFVYPSVRSSAWNNSAHIYRLFQFSINIFRKSFENIQL
jgi:hypothetical protein